MIDKQYKISVIIPIYNVEKYIAETIDSVIRQTIGFEENVQLVLMNDGSPDDSERVCLEYKEKYPNNILYIKQENSGVSNARNNALVHAKGELVTFLDSDDKWSKDAFKTAYNFWKKHKEVKVISCKMVFFDGKKGGHPLNYKYDKNRVVDITKDYKYIQLSSSSVFIERNTLLNYRYDATVKYSEDNKLMGQILLDNPKMGILKEPIYYYRRRVNLSSAIQNSTKSKSWYLDTPKNVYQYLFDLSIKKYSKIIDYMKFLVAYDIGWRLCISDYDQVLTESEQQEYIDIISGLIKQIDMKFFEEQENICSAEKLYILSIKESKTMKDCTNINGDVVVNDFDTSKNKIQLIIIDNAYIRENKLYMFFKFNTLICNKDDLKLEVDGKNKKLEFYELKSNINKISFKKEYIIKYMGAKCVIDLNKSRTIEFKYNNKKITDIIFGKKAMFTTHMSGSYYTYNKKILTYDKGQINISKNTFTKRLKREVKNILSLIRHKKIKHLIIRLIILFTRPFYSKNIWIISDRINMANDNGEHLFRYLCDKKTKKVKPYFAISKNSQDYKRMKQYGKVIDTNSFKYKLLFVHSKYIVSSHAEDYIANIFGKSNKYFYDLTKFKYIFLQHGITQNDLSPWLNPNNKHIDMIVSAAKIEYESLLKYGYEKDVIKLTGFARYDNLLKDSKAKKQILIQPTWRRALASEIDRKTGKRLYNDQFKNSDFFEFYNGLVNNNELIEFLKQKEYKIKLCLHPNLLEQIQDFKANEVLEIERGAINYQQEFKDAALLITDYSSVFFDVAYLKKPVIYTQFDEDEFYNGQIYDKGYFDYRKNGFGPICKDIASTVKQIKEVINNDCKMDKEYLNRVKNFYYKTDNKNCERIYNEIIKIK